MQQELSSSGFSHLSNRERRKNQNRKEQGDHAALGGDVLAGEHLLLDPCSRRTDRGQEELAVNRHHGDL